MKPLFKNTLRIAGAGAALLCASAAFAQAQTADAPPATPIVRAYERIGPGPDMGPGAIGFVRFEGSIDDKVVTGAPFTATISQETTQTLADGNRIVRNATGSFSRDSQGRTRRDMTLPAIGAWASSGKEAPHAIFVNDPVAGTHYVLDPARKMAHAMPARHGDAVTVQTRPPDAESTQIQQETTTVSLGTQTINGVSAQGSRTIRTIPAGEIGNTKPITITVERWYSPDLETYVLIKHSDPMMGDSVFQLTNIQRSEPEASLFQVPPDYTINKGRGMEVRIAPPPPDAGPDSQ